MTSKIVGFVTLARHAPREIAFAFLCNFASSPGQTFLIALFLPGIKASFGLGDAQVSNLYALATICSAALLWKIGRWIDRHDLLAYAFGAGVFLALACVLLAAAGSVPLLALGLLSLRLGGQGLLTHVAATATGRYFTQARGKALSLASLGFALGEAALPAAVVMLIGLWGWRPAIAAAGGMAMLLVACAVALVRHVPSFRTAYEPAAQASRYGGPLAEGGRAATGYRSLLMIGPLFVAQPLIVTALVFHQSVIALEKGISLQSFAVSFTAFALARLASGLLVGPAIDRFGSTRLFTFHLVPLCLAVAVLLPASAPWVLPVYWLLAGVTSGMATTLQVAILSERFPPHRLGAVRSLFASAMILASALGPALYGWLLACGVPVSGVLLCTLAGMIAATALALVADRNG